MKILNLLIVLLLISVSSATGEENESCRSLDTREFGLVSDGEISEPWSEIKLIERYGPPCQIIELGEVFIQRYRGRILDMGPKTLQEQKLKGATFAIKQLFVYKGDYSNPTSVFTIIDGVVAQKERIR